MTETSTEQTDYPDVEVALRELLRPIAKTVSVLTSWDEDTIRVQRIGGGDGEDGSDDAIVMLRCYAKHTPQRPRASQDVARQVRDYFKGLNDNGGRFAAGTLLERATKQSGPVTTPFDMETNATPEATVRVTELIYRVTVRD